MSNKFSLLQRATPASVQIDPFPHIILENALPDALYRELAESRPSPAMFGIDEGRNNYRWNYRAELVEQDARLPQVWKDFIAYQASGAFFDDIVQLFFPSINRLYPNQFPSLSYMQKLRVGVRGQDSFRRKDVLMDAMISGNTPVQVANSVRTTHIDNGRKLFSGLFYMRLPEDDSTGGDLIISRFRTPGLNISEKRALFKGAYVPEDQVEIVKTVKYQPNTLVLFINSIDSLHGVTVRQPTRHGRYFVNLVGEVVTRLYRNTRGQPVYVELNRPMDEGLFPPMEVLLQRLKASRGQVLTD